MKKGIIIRALVLSLVLSTKAAYIYAAIDYPHFGVNNIGCDSCHFVFGSEPSLLPPWTSHVPQDIDDTQYNTLCWSCHNDIDAPYMRTHSSLQTSNQHGDWTVECRVCHNPHYQKQFRTYGNASYLYSSTSTNVTVTTITKSEAGWTTDAYKGSVVVPNVSQVKYNYKILSNTSDTLTVQGPMNLNSVTAGDTFAIVYGQLIKETITLDNITITPAKSGNKTVKFFNSTGANSFADGNTIYDGVCEVCHTQTIHFRNDGTGMDQLHTNMNSPAGTNCTYCHKHENGFRGMGGGAHETHVISDNGPQLQCADCHGSNVPPVLGDGQDLANTTVCNNCHSVDGATTARTYWNNDPGTWVATDGQAGYCGGCHDETPGNSKQDGTGNTADNIVGDNSSYGFFVTGHGKSTGNYARLSWQDTSASGNPAANKLCDACHDLTTLHFGSADSRLKTGYENDVNNSNCKQCHDPGTVAAGNPRWYTTYAEYQSSAHGTKKCTECHNVHGAAGNYPAMTEKNQETLCYDCHKDPASGGIENLAISGSGLANDIQQAFSYADNSKHNLGTDYSINTSNYNLECVSCHNVHLVTGKYWQADQNVSPVTRISTPTNPQGNLEVWGDEAGEKMENYGGTYRTPNGDLFSGAQLPNYTAFCNECHQPMPDPKDQAGAHGQLNFDSDPHGLNSANVPNGVGICPDRYSCGKAKGWDGDDCVSDQSTCWPTMIRGKGDQLWSRPPYNHEERIAGANFALSCTDCHEAHGSSIRSMIRTNPNSGTGTTIWNTMCNNCHYYYSDWHAGMSCGGASCHVSDGSDRMAFTGTDSIHRMGNRYGDGSTRTFDPDLVFSYSFEGTLNDSGSWRMHGKWMDNISGTFTTGISGQAVVLDGGKNVQVGTRNSSWSTDAGAHGTWVYTHMKYNTTLEAWVYPNDDTVSEHNIYTKHTGYGNGDYAFTLQKINGTWRAAFICQIDNNAGTQGGASGLRGAYSRIDVPLNKWTHVAATFDTDGPDRDPNDPSVGRIRIYVNGEDVTTSNSSGNYMQPGAGETSIFAYPENSPWNQSICYNGDWCTSEFSIGGFYGWQNEFIGRLDEAKVWNITKDSPYFETVDENSPPRISRVEGRIGQADLTVTFSEGVYAEAGGVGDLLASDFTFTDADNGRTVSDVTQTAGASTANVTLSSPLDDSGDIDIDTLASASLSIFDEYSNTASTDAVTITMASDCPTGLVTFPLNDAPGSSYIFDDQTKLTGQVIGSGTLTGNEFSGGGEGSGRYILFNYNTSCLQASTAMTLEARIKPTGIPEDTTTNYITRILSRNTGGNYQMSVWRNEEWATFTAPSGEASIALWTYVNDNHGGNNWKLVLSNYTGGATGSENECGIVNDHWYLVKAVWDTDKAGGTPDQFFQPVDIYIDDQGTDGAGTGENWSGYVNCTDTDQSLKADNQKYYTGDSIKLNDGTFAIGIDTNNLSNNQFNGLIDWIIWKDTVD